MLSSLLFLGGNPIFAQKYDDRFASVSPDGKSLLFESNRVRPSHIFMVNIDGSGLRQITQDGGNSGPSWSPDAKSVIYSKIRDRQFFDVYVQDLEGQNIRQMTSDSSLNFASGQRGEWVYYTSNRNHEDQLRRINLASGQDELFMTDAEHHNEISFSPDGMQVAMITKNEGNNWDLALMNMAERKIIKEFPHPAREDSPQWSPKGDKIIFSSNRDGVWDIFCMSIDGSEVTNLTKGQGNSRFGSWFPNGDKIIFSSDRGGNGYRSFTMKTNGANQKELKLDLN